MSEAKLEVHSGPGYQCGQGPFARVSKYWTPNNQSDSATSKFKRSDGTTPQIHMLEIDANFTQSSSKSVARALFLTLMTRSNNLTYRTTR